MSKVCILAFYLRADPASSSCRHYTDYRPAPTQVPTVFKRCITGTVPNGLASENNGPETQVLTPDSRPRLFRLSAGATVVIPRSSILRTALSTGFRANTKQRRFDSDLCSLFTFFPYLCFVYSISLTPAMLGE